MLLLPLLIGPLDWTRKMETTLEKIYIARSHAPMKTSVQIDLRLAPDPDRGPPIEYPCHTVYILFIYFYITTLHILCTLLILHFWLEANCISLPQYLYSVQ